MNITERLEQDVAVGDYLLFYAPKDPFGIFSNFSRYGIVLPNPFTGEQQHYKTVEHRYQAMKAKTVEDHTYVARAIRASETKNRGRNIDLREGWGDDYGDLCWYVMVEALIAKWHQVPEFRKFLTDTESKHIYEDSPTDDIWGWRRGSNYNGKNLLGKALMLVRDIGTEYA